MAENSKWPGDECPPDCRYGMKISASAQGVSHRHCGYILYTGKHRGCEPGRGCCRYDNGRREKQPTKGVGPSWNVALGRELWLQGTTYGAIAEKVGTSRASVERRARMYWKNGRD